MPLRFPVSEFFQSSGNAAAEFTEKVRDEVATFACELWRDFPDFVTQSTSPASSFSRGFMNQMCVSLQPPLTPPSTPFTGGQCCDGQYQVVCSYEFRQCLNDSVVQSGAPNPTVTGKINGLEYGLAPGSSTVYVLDLVYEDCAGTEFRFPIVSNSQCQSVEDCFTTDPLDPDRFCYNLATSSWAITSVTRTDGQPDNCGNPNDDYGSPTPAPNQLNKTVNLTLNDGLDLSLEIQYIQIANQYNFPMNFKVNGVNVSLDFGGINFYAPDGFESPSGSNNVPPPGSDPGEDGVGTEIDKTFPTNEYPVAPEVPVSRLITSLIEYLVCTDGVISTVQETLKALPGLTPIGIIIIDILGQILTDLCEGAEATVGLPDYYSLRPGVERPAIVYLWKEFVGGAWDNSTYSSTVQHPTAAAIAAIPTINVPDRTLGTFITAMTLTDGSRIRSSGDTEANSLTNFTFLLDQVEPSFKPADIPGNTVVSEDTRLQVKTVKCRQIEYYPTGKQAGVSPAIRRVINA